MKTISKALVGTVAAGAMAMASATPTLARDNRHHDDGIDAGDVIAGALVIGGIAAIAASAGHDRDGRYRNRGDYRGYDRRSNPRSAVEQCVRIAESNANRYSYGGRAKVTDIRDVDRISGGYKVKGRIAVNTRGRNWRAGDSRYGRGWDGDYRGYNDRYRGYDSGKFTCKVKYGRVVDLDYSGIKGLR